MKSREEQMMHHLKNCCAESQKVWEEIIAWKARRKGMDVAEMAAGKKRGGGDKKRAPTTEHQSDATAPNTPSNKKARRNTTPKKVEEGETSSFVSGGMSSAMTSPHTKAPSLEHTKLNASQLRYFHKVCTIATATRKLDVSFFEDPVIMELFHVVRPAMVANGQLPNGKLLAGEHSDSTPGYIEKYATEQVTNDMYRIVRSVRRYEGLKAAVVVYNSPPANGRIPPSTLLCGGDLSCRIVPEMQGQALRLSNLEAETTTDGAVGRSGEHAVVALVNTVEAQLRLTANTLGKSIIGDEQDIFNSPLQKGKVGDRKAAAVTPANNNLDQSIDESKMKIRESAGLSYIGSCLLAGNFDQRRTECALDTSTVRRAQRILSRRWPMVYFTSHGCLEEQLNLLLKDILMKIPIEDFQAPMEQAMDKLRVLQQLSSKHWRDSILKCVRDTYGEGQGERDIAKDLLGEQEFICWSCWAPIQRALASLLRIRRALVVFADEHFSVNDFPNELRSFSDHLFWKKIERAEALIRPLARASFAFVPEKGVDSRDTPTMADLVHTFSSLYYSWSKAGLESAADLVEKRWRQYEHPWMILAFVLHPGYTREARSFLRKQSQEDGLFSSKYLSNAILGYTVKYLATELAGEHPLSIPLLKKQTSAYLDTIERGNRDSETSMQMKKDWKEYWNYQTSTPELSKFALFILSVTVQVCGALLAALLAALQVCFECLNSSTD